jgi:preprotein translocase subunit SecE
MSFIDYLKDTRAELRHVAWPTRTQTVVFTALVVAISVFVSAYLGIFDYLFTGILARVVNANTGTSQTVTPPAASSTPPITVTPVTLPTTTVKLK